MAFKLQHQTPTEFATKFRNRYKESSQEQSAILAKWLMDHLDNGDFVDSQIQNIFGLSVSNWAKLKVKLNALRTHWLAVKQAVGE